MADLQPQEPANSIYHRFHIQTEQAPDIVPWPSRFKVEVSKVGLAKHLLSELILTRFDLPVVTSRPCLYGVYSGPVGGFAPRPQLCVGCLRCTIEFPEFTRISPNPERRSLGDSYFTHRHVDAVAYEAESGRIPVKGAGYRGQFGGAGWDGMWTDMSEIVRPTRDGIHGREFISTVVDIGEKPDFLTFNEQGEPAGRVPRTFSIPLPFFIDRAHSSVANPHLYKIFAQAAETLQTLVVIPLRTILEYNLRGAHIVPLVAAGEFDTLNLLPYSPRMLEIETWDEQLAIAICNRFPDTLLSLRIPFTSSEALLDYADLGVSVFHLTANYHGLGEDGRFVFDLIRSAHDSFVQAGRRDEVTLLGSGGIVAAEHVPKAIIAGLDAVALDVPLLVALQGRFSGEFTGTNTTICRLPRLLPQMWAVQRITNLAAAWRDQLLEILGAMGLREVRRLRGEMGRALFLDDLEREAFTGIEGYDG